MIIKMLADDQYHGSRMFTWLAELSGLSLDMVSYFNYFNSKLNEIYLTKNPNTIVIIFVFDFVLFAFVLV